MSASFRLVADLRRTLSSLPEIERGIVVAVSGGPDSIALLRALLDARPSRTPIVIAHLNHRLRGKESDDDAAFVVDLHASLAALSPSLHIEMGRYDVASGAQQSGANLEAHARYARYRWLAEVARKYAMSWIATGHTANDQAETVLHRLLRGTGLQGLRGIAARRELEPGLGIVRPLLTWMRTDVMAYLDALGQTFRVDATNDDCRLTRNRIRHNLLPLLEQQYNPAIVSLLARLAQQAEEAFQEEDSTTRAVIREVELPRAGTTIVLNRNKLAALSRHRLRLLFRLIWQREKWPLDAMPHAAWEQLAALQGKDNAIDLPGGIRARAKGQVVLLQQME